MSFLKSLIWQITNLKHIADPSPIAVIQQKIDELARKTIQNKEHMVLLKQSITADEEVIRELNLYKRQLIQSGACSVKEVSDNIAHLDTVAEKSLLTNLKNTTNA